MTMNQKIGKVKKNGKKGFTLIELVIVIAILAILASIAIPVIATTISSAKLSVMKSDGESLCMLINECISTARSGIRTTTYGQRHVQASVATIGDVCYTNQLDINGDSNDDDNTFFKRSFGKKTYEMVYYKGHVCLYGDEEYDYGTPSDTAGSGDCVRLSANTVVFALTGNS